MITIITRGAVLEAYRSIMATEEVLAQLQEDRDNRDLDDEAWIVHDKDTGKVVAIGDTKTMAIKQAQAALDFPKVRARKHAWLDTDKYSIREFHLRDSQHP